MGGWRLEATRYLILVGFPVVSFWGFNQPAIFEPMVRSFKIPDASQNNTKMKEWKESMMEERRQKDYEKFLREQMAFEEAKLLREQNRI